MKKFKRLILLFIFTNLINSCGTLSDASRVLKNEKQKTTDEFLVKKRDPLSLPPDYDTIPKPNSVNQEKENNQFKKILKVPKNNGSGNTSSSIEKSILNKIGK